jgi:hypothetical protein
MRYSDKSFAGIAYNAYSKIFVFRFSEILPSRIYVGNVHMQLSDKVSHEGRENILF